MLRSFNEQRITGPASLPLTRAQVRTHLRAVNDPAEDSYLDTLIEAAVDWTERYLRRALIDQVWEQRHNAWPSDGLLDLHWVPVLSVTSIKYLDPAGVEQTLDSNLYTLIVASDLLTVIQFDYGWQPPAIHPQLGSIRVRYRAGYPPGTTSPVDPAANIPKAIKHAMLMQIAEMYENRETSIVGTIIAENPAMKNLLQPFRSLEI